MVQKDFGLEFDSLRIKVASANDIESWSHGEVLKPETINYRTQKPEREGLFDEKIFGPIKDYECYCGKYRKIRYKGVICDKCGVEVTRSSVRRERMGHINFCVPIAHIWYVRAVPSILGTVLNLSINDLEKVIYFASFIITKVNDDVVKQILEQLEEEYNQAKKKKHIERAILDRQYKETKTQLTNLAEKQLVSEEKYHELSLKYGNVIQVGIGSEAIYRILQEFDMEIEIKNLKENVSKVPASSQKKMLRRIKVLSDMQKAEIKPESLMLIKIPVIPPDLRPMVQLDGGRFAASDLNDLYRRVINRNNRLKKLIEQGAPEVITRNEKRMLQEAVDALIDNNSRRGKAPQTAGAGQRKLRSLSDMLKGKQGRFRQNLLGKRVDYSGRSVIVVGPELKLNQCGLPKKIALELYKPFVMSKLIKEGYVHNIKNAARLVDKGTPEVYEILERISAKSWVLLNRAPTLHRLGIQAFQPILVEGKAIQIHPLVCYAYNADFDGDQMAVHLPLSTPAKAEAEQIMASVKNLLKPASGEPVVQARYDIVYGIYYLTKIDEQKKDKIKIFSNKNEAILAYQLDRVEVRERIKVRLSNGKIIETSVGRILFNNIIPKAMRFINKTMDNKKLKKLLSDGYENCDEKTVVKMVDEIKSLGFHWAGKSGLTISIDDLQIPREKDGLVKKGDVQVALAESQFEQGLITEEERDFKIIDTWSQVKSRIEKAMIKQYDKTSPVYEMVASGSRGSFAQIIQMSGIKGLVVSPTGEIIKLPIKTNFKEGLSVYEYFISTHGARKGKSDTSLRTSDAGYLTRRLVDVSQDVVINGEDCGSDKYILVYRDDSENTTANFEERIYGRVAAAQISDPKTNKVIVRKNTVVSQTQAKQINESEISEIPVRTPIFCQQDWGICQKCYGLNMAFKKLAQPGDAVGIIAAQAIGEPGTQLTMKTFHLGGVQGEDITTGLPRVEEIFEARKPKRPALISPIDGTIKITEKEEEYDIFVIADNPLIQEIDTQGYDVLIKTGQKVTPRQNLAITDNKSPLRAKFSGQAKVMKGKIIVEAEEKETIQFYAPLNAKLLVNDKQRVEKGDLITDDHLNFEFAVKYQGLPKVIRYILNEIQKVYAAQGQAISDKHIEIIIRQMVGRRRVVESESYEYIEDQIINKKDLENIENKKLKVKTEPVIMGITRCAMKTESFLSSASFQETTNALITAAIKGATDNLKGLKENVIIGRLIPAGTGYRKP
ncbi:MAG: DNA-directed RNA polymerase subunit beta' [Candidatus Berkelbacteria bacterium Licking1014_7]|uniref:DNA-directed RNA polymerase subunit beta' n=1 Tax=Candidatus Berkelbacteria bacterium Licking1014_7 TaxID=2017147 RepID=A0A554LKJ6_9BACT|nr:MAG: DNA-directed RNA polymerase subunit beta' [Candidatus Berkelbacteria bacterium Licking1014_7]